MKPLVTLVAAVLLLTGCAASSAESTTSEPSPTASAPMVSNEVPDLTSLAVPAAVAKLDALDMGAVLIEMSTGDELESAVDRSVLRSFPESGKSVLSDRVVTLFVGAGEAPTPTQAPVALTAQAVVDVFATAGLPVADARDNSPQNCGTLGCVQMITTEDVTVLSFRDADAAAGYAAKSNSVELYQSGAMVLSYAAARTPEATRPAYEAALVELLSEFK